MSLDDAIESLNAYATDGAPTGGFLQAVLENDLLESFRRADDTSRQNLHGIVKYVYNELRSDCWGSPKIVKDWLRTKWEQRLAAESSSTAALGPA